MTQENTDSPTLITRLSILGIVPAIALYSLICYKFQFIQDDALISCRYVLNALTGHGLVFNVGEKIEGFTNFAWVIILMIVGKLGFSVATSSIVMGYVAGAAVIVVTWYIARELLADKPLWHSFIPVYLLAVNGSFGYWSPAGLETSFFALAASLALLFYLRQNLLLIPALLLAVWIRPDGALIAALLILAETISKREIPRFTLLCTATALILSLPFVAFKLFYYGSILPNPFHAKTSFDSTQLANGLQYTWLFLRQYGLFGAGFVIPILFFRKLTTRQRETWIFVIGFIAYVTFIGGDVLKLNRFYLPLLGLSAILITLSFDLIFGFISGARRQLAVLLLAVCFMAASWFYPLHLIESICDLERGLVASMMVTTGNLQEHDHRNFSVATSTIGTVGFTLPGHRVIDMVGLTDSTVARHPQTNISGIVSTWKEAKFNAEYVLSQSPDYIIFATGAKPSSPGEQALFLYDAFLDCYRVVVTTYLPGGPNGSDRPCIVYRRVRPITQPLIPNHPIEFVSAYKHALELEGDPTYDLAIDSFKKAQLALGPKIYPELMYHQAYCMLETQQDAYDLLNQILVYDSLVIGAHRELYMAENGTGNTAKAAIHRRFLEMLSPADIPEADSVIARYRANQGK